MNRLMGVVLLLGVATLSLFAQPSFPLQTAPSYKAEIPTIKSVLGYELGERHTRPDELIRYAEAVAKVSDRVKIKTYAYTYEGRPLIHVYITSPENHARLEEIRQQNLRLSDAPDRVSDADLETMPAIWYAGYSVHGNEASGSEASLWFLYHLAADTKEVAEQLKKMVIILDLCFNPDGRARFVDWVNRMRGGLAVADPQNMEQNEPWPNGRTNHYWFDLNRDWLVTAHPESKGRVEVFHEWRPQLLTDHHEMGSDASFFFQPGIPASTNPHTPESNVRLTEDLASYHVAALDQIRSLYFAKENFDDFYYGKGSTMPDINGAVGILFEQGSSRALKRESNDGVLHYGFTIRNQFVASLSSLKGLAEMRVKFLRHQRDFYREAKTVAAQNVVKAYILDQVTYPARTEALVQMLLRHRIQVHRLKTATAGISNGFIIPMDQPQVRLLKGIMEKVTAFRDSSFYDISTWTMPLAYGVPYAEVTATPNGLIGERITAYERPEGKRIGGMAKYAYLVRWGDYYAPRALFRLQAAGLQPRLANKPFTAEIAGKQERFDRGTLIIPLGMRALNGNISNNLEGTIEAILKEDRLDVYALSSGWTPDGPDLGSNNNTILIQPRMALVVGSGTNANDVGEVWHVIAERYKLPISLIEWNDLSRLNLDRYNVLLMADGTYAGASQVDKIKTWVANGGTLVTMVGAAQWAIKNGLVDEKMKESKPLNLSKLPYADLATARIAQQIAGAIFEAKLDITHPLAYGYKPQTALFRSTELLFQPSVTAGANVALYTSTPRLSGYISDEMLAELKDTAALIARKSGRGSIILMADNPNFRAFWYGTNGLMMNAIFFGKSF